MGILRVEELTQKNKEYLVVDSYNGTYNYGYITIFRKDI